MWKGLRMQLQEKRAKRSRAPGRGFSLLELLLALSLTVVVLMLVNMAVEFHLRSLDTRRMQLEEAQLARSILRMIANDLRGAVQHYEQDMSGIESLLQQSVASAAGSIGQAAAEAGGAAIAGAAATAGGQPNSADASSGISAAALQSQSGSPSQGSSGGSASSANRSSSGSQGSSTSMSSSSGSGAASGETTGQNTEDLSTTTIPPVPGLFGNQYQMQIDISRLPRVEDYQRFLTADAATSVVDIPSDLKTVTYFVQSMPSGATAGTDQPLENLADPNANGTGLVRRELDRSVTLWAMNNGNYAGLENSGEVIAPEVAAVEFQYFNGTEWLTTWDSEAEKKLPIAVLVILALRRPGTVATVDVPPSSLTPDTASNLNLYRMLVHLPAGGQSAEESSEGASTSGSDTSSSDTSSAATAGGTM